MLVELPPRNGLTRGSPQRNSAESLLCHRSEFKGKSYFVHLFVFSHLRGGVGRVVQASPWELDVGMLGVAGLLVLGCIAMMIRLCCTLPHSTLSPHTSQNAEP